MTKKVILPIIFILILAIIGSLSLYFEKSSQKNGTDNVVNVSTATTNEAAISLPRVGIQIGHWKTDELPDELWKLHWNYGGESGNYTEIDSNTTIANLVVDYLEAEGVTVDLLPATIPVDYEADAFLSIHADGNDDTTVSGYKITWSEFDTSGESQKLSDTIETLYAQATQLDADPNISSDMTEYYAFNYNKYVHTLDPSTPAAIIETGFITNSGDRKMIVSKPEVCARAIADGILEYLRTLDFDNWQS